MAVRPDGQRSPLAKNLCAGLGRLAYEHNQLNVADQYIHECIDLCRQWGEFDLQAIAFAMQARLAQARGNPESAQEAVRKAEQLAVEHSLSSRRSIQLKSDLARYYLAQGNLEKVSQLIKQNALSIKDRIPYQREPEYVILLRILLCQNDHDTALSLSNRMLKQAEQTGRKGLVIEILIVQTLAFQGKKETEQALVTLERALALAQPEECVRSFLDEGEAMTRLLCQVQSRQTGNSYAAVLLDKIGKISRMTQPSMQLLIEPLTAREVEVLKLIKAGSSNQDIASQLVISITTVKRHISNIYAKLGVKSRTQAVAIGKELKIFE
jgi:LuxR family maltose regulon positive regulatory protein